MASLLAGNLQMDRRLVFLELLNEYMILARDNGNDSRPDLHNVLKVEAKAWLKKFDDCEE